MSLTERTREFALAAGADLVAAVPVCELPEVPQTYKPDELVPGARSVLVISLKMVDAIWDRLTGKPDFFSETLHNYLIGYNYPRLDVLAIQTARFLEKEGYDAFPIQAPSKKRVRYTEEGLTPQMKAIEEVLLKTGKGIFTTPFAFKPTAVAAGLGSIGKHSMVITPEYGPRARFVCVVTDAPLERTQPPVTEEPGSVCGECRLCLDACPVGALGFDEEERRPLIDRVLCNAWLDHCQCALCQGVCPWGKRRKRVREGKLDTI